MNNYDKYEVVWSEDAERALLKHKKYFNVKRAYQNSFSILSDSPHDQRDGILNCGFEFDGYYWANINNAIMFYRVDDEMKKVFIEGCDSAVTGKALKNYYGEYDPWEED